MKKIVTIIIIILAIVSVVFAGYKALDYYNKKNKVDNDKTLLSIDDKIIEVEKKIQEELKKEEDIKLEKKDKIEELELWKQKKKEIIENI